jgi:hypothetical protein
MQYFIHAALLDSGAEYVDLSQVQNGIHCYPTESHNLS